MDAEERISMERRMGQLEKQLATYDVLLRRNSEILDEIRVYMNKPTAWPEGIAATVSVLLVCGALLYTAYIKPLERQVEDLAEVGVQNAAYVRSIGDYAKETRGLVDEHVSHEEHRPSHRLRSGTSAPADF
jgi:hypothetical protein